MGAGRAQAFAAAVDNSAAAPVTNSDVSKAKDANTQMNNGDRGNPIRDNSTSTQSLPSSTSAGQPVRVPQTSGKQAAYVARKGMADSGYKPNGMAADIAAGAARGTVLGQQHRQAIEEKGFVGGTIEHYKPTNVLRRRVNDISQAANAGVSQVTGPAEGAPQRIGDMSTQQFQDFFNNMQKKTNVDDFHEEYTPLEGDK